MYGKGNLISTLTTGSGSVVAVVGGISVLPHTNGSPMLFILGVTTSLVGALVFISFVTTRIILRKHR